MPFLACVVFTAKANEQEQEEYEDLDTHLANGLTGEQMRLRVYAFQNRTYCRAGTAAVVMLACRGPLVADGGPADEAEAENAAANDAKNAAAASSSRHDDWFQSDQRPDPDEFFRTTIENTSLGICIQNKFCN
jgi:hypothetical protein